MLAKHVRPLLSSGVNAIVRWLQHVGVTPNMVSFAGFALTIGAAALLATGNLRIGGGLLWVAAMFDMVDGTLARVSQNESKFGAFLDSTLDRYSESVTFLGLVVYYANAGRRANPSPLDIPDSDRLVGGQLHAGPEPKAWTSNARSEFYRGRSAWCC